MIISGSCFCRQVSYTVSGSLRNARSCHCSRCRKLFGGAGSAYAEIEDGTFAWTGGNENIRLFQTGPSARLAFCSICSSPLAGLVDNRIHGVTLGTVDGDPGVELEMHIFVGSKAPWDHIAGEATQFLEGPDEIAT